MVASLIWRDHRFNQRTIDMLTAVETRSGQELYITQGSYNPGGVEQSFGTHDGGGVVDLWPINGIDVAEGVIAAMRAVGFAAWIRDPSQGDWGYHIHAVAIDDPDLSQPAQVQIIEYLGGDDGLGEPDYHPRPNPIITWEEFSGTVLPPTDVNGGRRIVIDESMWINWDETGPYPYLRALGPYIPQELNESVPLITTTTPGGPVAFTHNDPRGTYVAWRFEPGPGEYLIDSRLNRLFDGHQDRSGEWRELYLYEQPLSGGAITKIGEGIGSFDLSAQDGFRYYVVVGGVTLTPEIIAVGGGMWGVLRVTDKAPQMRGWFREDDRKVLVADSSSVYASTGSHYAVIPADGAGGFGSGAMVSSFGFKFSTTIYNAFGGPQPGTMANAGQWAWDDARRGGQDGSRILAYNHNWQGTTNEEPYQPPTAGPPSAPYATHPPGWIGVSGGSPELEEFYEHSSQVGYRFIYTNNAAFSLRRMSVDVWIAEKQLSAEQLAREVGFRAKNAIGENDLDYSDLYVAQNLSSSDFYVEFENEDINIIKAWVAPDKKSEPTFGLTVPTDHNGEPVTTDPTMSVNWYLVAPVAAEFAGNEIWGPFVADDSQTWRFGGRGGTQISHMFGRTSAVSSDWLEFDFDAARQFEANNPSIGGALRFLGVPHGFEDPSIPPNIQGYGVQNVSSSEVRYSPNFTLAYEVLIHPPRYRMVPYVFEPTPYSPTYALSSEEGGEVDPVDGPDSNIDGEFETSRARFT